MDDNFFQGLARSGYASFFSFQTAVSVGRDPTNSPIVPFEREKKRSHDAAYLLILFTILVVTFLFVTYFVNNVLHSIPIPP